MHAYCEFSFERDKFQPLEVFSKRKEEGFVGGIIFILPAFRGMPRNSTVCSNHISKLSFCDRQGVYFSITCSMKSLSTKLMLRSSIQKLNIVNLFFNNFLKSLNVVLKQASFKLISIVSELILNFFHLRYSRIQFFFLFILLIGMVYFIKIWYF